MQEIEDGLLQARFRLSGGVTEESASEVIAILTGIGAQLGGLQVECCAPERMPLYAKALEGLTATQLSLNAELGKAH